MTKERRFPRVDIDFPISCTFIDAHTQVVLTSPGQVLNISLGGMRIIVPIPKPMINASSLTYSLTLPEPFSTLTGKGQIKWSDRDDNKEVIVFGMAFENVSPEHLELINTLIDEMNEN